MENLKVGMWVVLDDDSHTMIGKVTEISNKIVIWVNEMMFITTENNIRPLTIEFLDQLKKEVTNG